MYTYVTKAELKPYKTFCHEALTELQQQLKTEDITMSINLIGSGAGNLVTQNAKGEFDLDYNLSLSKIPEKYLVKPHALKDKIRTALDKIMLQKNQSCAITNMSPYGQDSKSVITYKCCLPPSGDPKIERLNFFHLDIALMIKDTKFTSKLTHDKRTEAFIWNQLPDFSEQTKQLNFIKSHKKWNNVRNLYLQKKNDCSTKALPSYAIYSMALNEVYQKFNHKK